jgi:hypothetical protein
MLGVLCSTDAAASDSSQPLAVVVSDAEGAALWEAWEGQSSEVPPYDAGRLASDASWNQCLALREEAEGGGARGRRRRRRRRGLGGEGEDESGSSLTNSSSPPSLEEAYEWTVLGGIGIKTRLEDRELAAGPYNAAEPGSASAPSAPPLFYAVWTLAYPVLQVGAPYYYRARAAEDPPSGQEMLAVYEDGSGGGGGEEAPERARRNLERALQGRLDAALASGAFESALRRGLGSSSDPPPVRASIVGRELETFVVQGGGDGAAEPSSSPWTARRIAVAVLWGLLGLIAACAAVLAGVLLRGRCGKAPAAATVDETAVDKASSFGGASHEYVDIVVDLDGPYADPRFAAGKVQEVRSVTSLGSFLDSDDDPGNCWIPVPSVLRVPDAGGVGAFGNLWRHALSSWSRDDEGTDDARSDGASLLELTDDDDEEEDRRRGYFGGRGADADESDGEDADARSLKSTATDLTPTTVEIDLDTCRVVRPERRRVRFCLGPEAAAPAPEAAPLGASAAEGPVAAAVADISAAGEAGSARAAEAETPPETAELVADTARIVHPDDAQDLPLVDDNDGGDSAPVSLSPEAEHSVDACLPVPPAGGAKDKTLVGTDRSGGEAPAVGLNDSGHTADLSFSSLSDAAEEEPAEASSPAPVLEARLLPVAEPPTASHDSCGPEEKAASIACNPPGTPQDDDAPQSVPTHKPEAPLPAKAPSTAATVSQGDVAAGGLG